MNYVSDTIFSKLAMLSGIILYNAAMFLKQGIQMLTPEQVKSLAQLASNELHALSISVAATPAEWAAKQQ